MTTDPEGQPVGDEPPSEEGAADMGALLQESTDVTTPRRGDIIEGVMMGWDRDGALVDIGSKTEGIVHRHEMHSLGADPESKLQPGDKVLVFVVHPETAEGQILLSIDRARGEQGWRTLQERFESGESFDGDVTGYNRGGLLVNVEGVNAFVPLSQVVGVRPDRARDDGGSHLAENVGRTLRLKVIEINRRRNRVILSERAALQEWRLEQKERLIQELREGEIRRGRVSSVRSFGVFVDLGGADGLAHLSELSWERNKTPSELFRVGDEVDVYVTKIDAENKKIALSLRRANPAQWEAAVDKYREGQVVPGLVTKLVTFGAFARVDGPVEGLIHVSELVDQRIGHPKEVVREGDLLPLKIVRIERDRHRLGLSLRQARKEGQAMGFVFSDGGEVISVPDAIRSEFEAREGPWRQVAPATEVEETAEGVMAEAPVAEEDAAAEPATEVEETAEGVMAEAPVAEEEAAGEPAAEVEETAEGVMAEAPVAEEEAAGEPAAEVEEAAEASVEEAPVAEAQERAEEAGEGPAAELEEGAVAVVAGEPVAAEEVAEALGEDETPKVESASVTSEDTAEAEAEAVEETEQDRFAPAEETPEGDIDAPEEPSDTIDESAAATSTGGEEEDPTVL